MNGPPKKEAKLDAQYVAQIEGMSKRAYRWVQEHPEAKPLVQFNWPPRCMLIAPLSVAIEKHYMTVNEDGKAMLAAACAGIEEELEPTAFMARMAVEHMEEINR